jgi:Protein of unknown function, DUF488
MQKTVKRSVPGINAMTGGRGGKRMPNAESSPIVLTIGHSTRTLEEFMRLLQARAVSRVVDVRTVPRSWHNPQFNKASLPRALKKAGLGYVHMHGTGRPASCEARFAQRRLAQCFLSGLHSTTWLLPTLPRPMSRSHPQQRTPLHPPVCRWLCPIPNPARHGYQPYGPRRPCRACHHTKICSLARSPRNSGEELFRRQRRHLLQNRQGQRCVSECAGQGQPRC